MEITALGFSFNDIDEINDEWLETLIKAHTDFQPTETSAEVSVPVEEFSNEELMRIYRTVRRKYDGGLRGSDWFLAEDCIIFNDEYSAFQLGPAVRDFPLDVSEVPEPLYEQDDRVEVENVGSGKVLSREWNDGEWEYVVSFSNGRLRLNLQ